ncbi:hypothetical protein BDF14DRAFT_1005659 [Spinellus fusiger]|nr:hypothetical protein BDF14DRAFT_1005659 [Spinellus fusiger]
MESVSLFCLWQCRTYGIYVANNDDVNVSLFFTHDYQETKSLCLAEFLPYLILVLYYSGILVFWYSGILVFWYSGILVFWYFGILIPVPIIFTVVYSKKRRL